MIHTALSSIVLLLTTHAQFVTPPTDLRSVTGGLNLPVRYKATPPGFCHRNVTAYSGYVDVDENTHMFFWLFEASQNPEKAPLTIYMDGGPGYPAEPAVSLDLGLCAASSANASNSENFQYSWNSLSNVLVLDQPNQVGFSYSHPTNGCVDDDGNFTPTNDPNDGDTCGTYSDFNIAYTANGTWAAAPIVWKTVQGFLGAFPKYAGRDVHIATISYGGHFGPVFGQYFEEQNDLITQNKLSGAQSINLKTVFIGDGWFDPQLQFAGFYNFTVSPGNTYDYKPFSTDVANQMFDHMYGQNNCWYQVQECYDKQSDDLCQGASNYCTYNVQYTFDNYTVVCQNDPDNSDCEDDISNDASVPYPDNSYFNDPAYLQAVGAFTNYTSVNVVANDGFNLTGDNARSTLSSVDYLVKRGIYVVQYHGDRDYTCNWIGGEAVAERLNAAGWSSAEYANISTPDGKVHGQVKQSGYYAFARIYEASHEAAYWQPETIYTMLSRAISGMDLASGKQSAKGYTSTGAAQSTYEEGASGLVNPTVGET